MNFIRNMGMNEYISIGITAGMYTISKDVITALATGCGYWYYKTFANDGISISEGDAALEDERDRLNPGPVIGPGGISGGPVVHPIFNKPF